MRQRVHRGQEAFTSITNMYDEPKESVITISVSKFNEMNKETETLRIISLDLCSSVEVWK